MQKMSLWQDPERSWKSIIFSRHALFIALFLIACDSTSTYRADLGQNATLPLVNGVLAPPTAAGQTFNLVAPNNASFPPEWLLAQSLKIQLSGALLIG